MNPRPSDYKAQPRGFYRLLQLTVSPSETAVYGPLASRSTTPDFYHFLRRVPKVFTIVELGRGRCKSRWRPLRAGGERGGWTPSLLDKTVMAGALLALARDARPMGECVAREGPAARSWGFLARFRAGAVLAPPPPPLLRARRRRNTPKGSPPRAVCQGICTGSMLITCNMTGVWWWAVVAENRRPATLTFVPGSER